MAKSVNPDGSYTVAHFDVTGLGYSAYSDITNSAGIHLAQIRSLNDGSAALLLYGNGLTIDSGPNQIAITTGADTFATAAASVETITANGHTGEVFAYETGFGQSTIKGFVAAGGSHDILQFPTTMYSDATALLNSAVQVGANVEITDPFGDTLTLNHVARTTLAANPGDFRFA